MIDQIRVLSFFMRCQWLGGAGAELESSLRLPVSTLPSHNLLSLLWNPTMSTQSPDHFPFMKWNAGILPVNPTACGHFTPPEEPYLTETQLLTNRGFRSHAPWGHSDPVFCYCPGPRTYKPIKPVLPTNGCLSGIGSYMAVILIMQTVNAKKILLTLVFMILEVTDFFQM